jgi:hypothetical protein
MFSIVKKTEPVVIGGITVTIYGDAGTGKTTLANTASKPIIIDFDNGYHRSSYRQEYIPIGSWADISDNMHTFFDAIAEYDTIVIDTVGSMLDYITIHLIEREPRLAKATMQMYGELKKTFQDFHRRLTAMNKNVVFIAHAREKEENEQRRLRPNAQGSSYDLVIQKSDLVGYMTVVGGKTVLDFDATEQKIGKNCANLKPMVIGDLVDIKDFMADLFTDVKRTLQLNNEKQTESIESMNSLISEAQQLSDADEFNAFIDVISTSGLNKSEKLQIWNKVINLAKQKGIQYIAKNKVFVDSSEVEND